MKNTAKLCAVTVVSLCLLCSCSKAPNNGTSQNYSVAQGTLENVTATENEYVDYTFEYPGDWTIIRNDGMIAVQSSEEKVSDRVSISCTTFSVDPNLTVLEYWDGDGTEEKIGYYAKMKETIGGDFKEISRTELELGNTGAPALMVTYSATTVDMTYQFSQVVSIISGDVYTFTYTALPERFEEWKPAFTHAVASFKLK